MEIKQIKRYRLTEKAEQQYRKGAKQAKDIPLPVLECKLSSLIYASKDRYYYSDEDATIAFGSCLITFSVDEITDIRWCKENHGSGICRQEKAQLLQAHSFFGLNKDGVAFFEDEKE